MTRTMILLSVWLLVPAIVLGDEGWPQFRGPDGQGHADVGPLPVSWSKTEGVRWTAEIPGKGWSSPVLTGGRLYLTTAVPEGEGGDMAAQSLRALCVDAKTGKIVWDNELFQQPAGQRIHAKNSHASASPVIDGDRLYVHFGTHGTACLDLAGKVIWTFTELKYEPRHGNGGSPVLVDGLLVVNCDGSDVQFVAALDQKTGKLKWKTPRSVTPAKGFAFCTPLVIEINGGKQIVSPGPDAVCGYQPSDGKELWKVRYAGGYSVVPRPVFGQGLVFLSTGYDSPRLLAIDPSGSGDVTDTHLKWEMKKGAPLNPSPLLVGKELYLISDNGIATCVDARTGDQHWQQRIGGNFSSSPLYADGKIYLQSEEGEGIVLKGGTAFEELARNSLGDRTLASYAVAPGAIFIRSEHHLRRIESGERAAR